jgi:hypothetical protein
MRMVEERYSAHIPVQLVIILHIQYKIIINQQIL